MLVSLIQPGSASDASFKRLHFYYSVIQLCSVLKLSFKKNTPEAYLIGKTVSAEGDRGAQAGSRSRSLAEGKCSVTLDAAVGRAERSCSLLSAVIPGRRLTLAPSVPGLSSLPFLRGLFPEEGHPLGARAPPPPPRLVPGRFPPVGEPQAPHL